MQLSEERYSILALASASSLERKESIHDKQLEIDRLQKKLQTGASKGKEEASASFTPDSKKSDSASAMFLAGKFHNIDLD